MSKFRLMLLALEMLPGRFSCLNSRGGASYLDTFLVSAALFRSGAVKLSRLWILLNMEVITPLFI